MKAKPMLQKEVIPVSPGQLQTILRWGSTTTAGTLMVMMAACGAMILMVVQLSAPSLGVHQ